MDRKTLTIKQLAKVGREQTSSAVLNKELNEAED